MQFSSIFIQWNKSNIDQLKYIYRIWRHEEEQWRWLKLQFNAKLESLNSAHWSFSGNVAYAFNFCLKLYILRVKILQTMDTIFKKCYILNFDKYGQRNTLQAKPEINFLEVSQQYLEARKNVMKQQCSFSRSLNAHNDLPKRKVYSWFTWLFSFFPFFFTPEFSLPMPFSWFFFMDFHCCEHHWVLK